MSARKPGRRPMRYLLVDSEGRLRAGWRLLVFGAITIVLQAFLVLLLAFVVDPRRLLQGSLSAADPVALIPHGIAILVSTGAVYLSRRWLDRRSFVSLGLRLHSGWQVHLLAGALLGIALQAVIFCIELAMGWLVIESVGWRTPGSPFFGLVFMLVVFLAVAWNEELVVRGYVLQNLEDGLGTRLAVIVSSVAFGVLHIFNSNASIVAVIGVSVAGLLLAVAYLVTRTLWLAIGLHLGWNYAEGPIFGFPVSGLDAGGLFTHRAVGPEAVTGAAFGPEAGLLAVVLQLIGIVVLVLWWSRCRSRADDSVAD